MKMPPRRASTQISTNVERGDYLTVLIEEGQPPFGFALIRITPWPPKIARHGGLGNLESEL